MISVSVHELHVLKHDLLVMMEMLLHMMTLLRESFDQTVCVDVHE